MSLLTRGEKRFLEVPNGIHRALMRSLPYLRIEDAIRRVLEHKEHKEPQRTQGRMAGNIVNMILVAEGDALCP